MKYALLIPAIILDILQFLLFWVFWAIEALTPVGGGVTGAAAGAYLCYNASTGVVSGVLSGLKCAVGGALVGAGVATVAGPLGMVLDTALSLTIGGAILVFMALEGMFYFDIIIPSFMGEALPLLNFLPFWTIMVWRCISRKRSGGASSQGMGKGLVSGLATAAVGIIGGGAAAQLGVGAVASMARRAMPAIAPAPAQQPAHVVLQTKNFDGIRAANDNAPKPYAQAA